MNNQSNKHINSNRNGTENNNYPPAWVEKMQKWQEENPNDRAVLCIATDNNNSINTLFGSSLELTFALLAVMYRESGYVNICKGALKAKENPIAALALVSALEKYKKERENSTKEEKDTTPDDSSMKEFLKTILTKLTDKL